MEHIWGGGCDGDGEKKNGGESGGNAMRMRSCYDGDPDHWTPMTLSHGYYYYYCCCCYWPVAVRVPCLIRLLVHQREKEEKEQSSFNEGMNESAWRSGRDHDLSSDHKTLNES